MYLDDQRDYFWRYYVDRAEGRYWWFGFEPGGPPADPTNQRNRPLVKSKGVLAKYMRSTDNGLQCPSFPYDSGFLFSEVRGPECLVRLQHSVGSGESLAANAAAGEYLKRAASIFVFADGVHFDFNPGMNEGHYIDYVDTPARPLCHGGICPLSAQRPGGRAFYGWAYGLSASDRSGLQRSRRGGNGGQPHRSWWQAESVRSLTGSSSLSQLPHGSLSGRRRDECPHAATPHWPGKYEPFG